MEDLTGKQLGAFRVVAPLGEGGMAAVYKAFQPSTGRYVALKILPRLYADDPAFVGRFTQEARLIAQLEHPHILPIFDFGQSDGYTYLAMRLVEGGTLASLMQQGPCPVARQRQILSEVADALDYAHAHGVIHRDIKPSNVLLDRTGHALLADFGLAKMVEGNIHLTHSGALVGTPAYMSPEQCLGEAVDGRSDVYSLGVVLYELVMGQPPYAAETPVAVVLKHLHDPLPVPRSIRPDLPEAQEQVLLKALAKQREDRYQTAGEMARAFRQATPESAPAAASAAQPAPRLTFKALWPGLYALLILAAAWALATATGYSPAGNPDVLGVVSWALGGFALAWFLNRIWGGGLRGWHVITLGLGWAAGWLAASALLQALAVPAHGPALWPALLGASLNAGGALVTVLTMRWARPALGWRRLAAAGLLMLLAWAVGWLVISGGYTVIGQNAAGSAANAGDAASVLQAYLQVAEALGGAVAGLLSGGALWGLTPGRQP